MFLWSHTERERHTRLFVVCRVLMVICCCFSFLSRAAYALPRPWLFWKTFWFAFVVVLSSLECVSENEGSNAMQLSPKTTLLHLSGAFSSRAANLFQLHQHPVIVFGMKEHHLHAAHTHVLPSTTGGECQLGLGQQEYKPFVCLLLLHYAHHSTEHRTHRVSMCSNLGLRVEDTHTRWCNGAEALLDVSNL